MMKHNKRPVLTQDVSPILLERVQSKQPEIYSWLNQNEKANELPLYSSVDIRNAGFKMAVVDTNLFPAGFNNLCEHGIEDAVRFFREAIFRRVADCHDILVIAEEHTRNAWYLENVRILQHVLSDAGFCVKVATFLGEQPVHCEEGDYIDLTTATGEAVRLYCFRQVLDRIRQGIENFDLIIMNNDLTHGIPDVLKDSRIPIYPSVQAGWHSRLKSHHFWHTADLINDFASIVDVDPWLFSALYTVVDAVDINNPADRERLADEAGRLLNRIKEKYNEHLIEEKPYLIIKPDAGTYGMGVKMLEDPQEIITLNRKDRNKLYKGKGAKVVSRYLIQEGIPTIYSIDNQVSEVCIYQVENNLVGGFYRSHSQKSSRDNLNAQGMIFQKMCPHLKKYGDCGVHHDINIFDVYRILARIAAIAAHREMIQLEAQRR